MKNILHGITFAKENMKKHTWKDWGIVPTSRPVFDPPKPRRILQSIPGMEGSLDLSTALTGEMMYENRTGHFEFYVADKSNWARKYAEILNFLHGQKMKIALDDEPGFHYKGMIVVDNWKSEQKSSKIVIEADVYPYKLKNDLTEITATVKDQAIVTCQNLRKSVIPKIITDVPFELQFGKRTVNVNPGTSIVPNLKFLEGENFVNCKGNGTITFQYQEGSL